MKYKIKTAFCCLLPAFGILIPELAKSQTPPNAGSISRDAVVVKPVVPATNTTLPQTAAALSIVPKSTDPTPIPVKSISITGATAFSPEVLQDLVAHVATGTHTLGQLQEAASRITAHYRKAGYFLARAYLPAQKMEGGVVTIAVMEGKLSEVKLENSSRVSDSAINNRLAAYAAGTLMQKEPLDRALLLLGDVPGVSSVDSRLAPGKQTGETVLVVVAKPAPAWAGKLEADNFGSPSTGRYRGGINVEGNSPLGYGEKLSANILASDEKMVYGRAGVQVPVGAGGLTVGAGVNHSQYELGDTYKDLDAVGNSDTFEINAKYPLVRTVPFNLYLQGTAEQRKLHDDIRSTQTVTDKQSKVASVSLLADWQDNAFCKQAQSQASVTVTGGKLAIDSEDAAAIDAKVANTTGSYSKFGISLSRQQAIADKLSLTAQVRGQWANKNLDSSEKFSLGGANGVRAYPSGEASGDSGWLASLELRYAVIPQMAVSVFYDAGSVSVNTNPYLTTDNKKSLAGAGIGLSGEYEAFNWRTTLAWRNGDPSTAETDKKPRFWVQAGWRF